MVGQHLWITGLCILTLSLICYSWENPASLVLSWVLKYKIKARFENHYGLSYAAFVPLLRLQRNGLQSGASSLHYLWLEFAEEKKSKSQAVQMQSGSSEPLVHFSWIWSISSVLCYLPNRLQYWGFVFARSANKEKEKHFCTSNDCTLLQQLIFFWDLRVDQE